jgi:hypothetical protein
VTTLRGGCTMVQAADLGNGHDRAERGWRDRPGVWRVLGEREMRSRLVIVREVSGQHARQPGFIHDDHMIETLASNGADDTLHVRVLPRRAWRREDLMDPHPGRGWSDPREGVITIANEIARDLVPRKRLGELLGGPRRRGMGGNGHVHDATTLMRQDDHHKEESTRGGGDDEEIGGRDLADMIGKKRAPRL